MKRKTVLVTILVLSGGVPFRIAAEEAAPPDRPA